MKANAVIFVQPEEVALKEIELPVPGEEDILVETEVSGISVGTERWTYLGKRREIGFPSVPGYMGVGTIRKVGMAASKRGWEQGERVYYFSSRLGEEFEGKSWMGSHVSQAVVNVCGPRGNGPLGIHHCEKVPAGVGPEEAALLGLCGVAMRGIEMAVIPASSRVLICGLGVLGQYALQLCLLKGAEVAVTDVVESRLETAKALGAHHAINGANARLEEDAEKIAPEGFDIIIDTSSIPTVVNGLFPLLKLRGKFIFQGWYPPPANLDLDALHQRLPTAFFPCAHGAEHVATALRWAQMGWLRSAPLITHTFRPAQAGEAYAMIAAGSENFLGVIFDWREQA